MVGYQEVYPQNDGGMKLITFADNSHEKRVKKANCHGKGMLVLSSEQWIECGSILCWWWWLWVKLKYYDWYKYSG